MLFLEAIAEYDRVVNGQRQLQNTCHGVGNEGYLSKQIVAALIEHQRHNKRQDQHRHLAVGFRGEQQHHDNDDGDIDHNDVDLVLDRFLLRIAEVGLDINVVGGQQLLHGIQRI